jgi:hypothetical protein
MQTDAIAWVNKELKDPVSFRRDDEAFIVRKVKNVKGRIMCECEMDDDKIMVPIETLPNEVQDLIKKRIPEAA